jgi:hypothetical protein
MSKNVPDTELAAELALGSVPNLAFIMPDQCHDLHGIGGTPGCTGDLLSQQTDRYLKSTVDVIMQSDLWPRGENAIVVTFDEGDSTLGCCDATPGGGRIVTVAVRKPPAAAAAGSDAVQPLLAGGDVPAGLRPGLPLPGPRGRLHVRCGHRQAAGPAVRAAALRMPAAGSPTAAIG